METFSALLAICAGNSPVPGEFPAQRPVTRSFDVFFDLRLNKRLSKQWWDWWFETLSHPLWRHRNVRCTVLLNIKHIYTRVSLQWAIITQPIRFRLPSIDLRFRAAIVLINWLLRKDCQRSGVASGADTLTSDTKLETRLPKYKKIYISAIISIA